MDIIPIAIGIIGGLKVCVGEEDKEEMLLLYILISRKFPSNLLIPQRTLFTKTDQTPALCKGLSQWVSTSPSHSPRSLWQGLVMFFSK